MPRLCWRATGHRPALLPLRRLSLVPLLVISGRRSGAASGDFEDCKAGFNVGLGEGLTLASVSLLKYHIGSLLTQIDGRLRSRSFFAADRCHKATPSSPAAKPTKTHNTAECCVSAGRGLMGNLASCSSFSGSFLIMQAQAAQPPPGSFPATCHLPQHPQYSLTAFCFIAVCENRLHA